MTFNQRFALQKEYSRWVELYEHSGALSREDSINNMLLFLEEKGLLKEDLDE